MTEILAATAALLATVETRTFDVLLCKLAYVVAALEKINKRAERKGLSTLTYTQGKAYTETKIIGTARSLNGEIPSDAIVLPSGEVSVKVDRVPFTIIGNVPRFEGWTFVATLQHLEGDNILRCVPGSTVPAIYRSRGPVCDHCKINRRRNDTYVVRHESGEHKQVGSTCIADFLGSDEAGKIAAQAEFFAEAGAIAEGACEGSGSSEHDRLLSDFLAWVSFSVRETGWTSRTVARDQGGQATADHAWGLMTSDKARADYRKSTGKEAKCTAEDIEAGETSEQWAETLSDSDVDGQDYLHNIRAIARTGLVTFRTAGLGGSILVAYQRAMGEARQAKERAARPSCNEYMGTVGAKVTFGLPPVMGKRGPLKNAPTVLSSDPLTLDFVTGYETQYGYTTLLSFRTSEGHTIVWKASDTSVSRQDVGKKFTLAGSIKAHTEYKGTKQTLMTRCAVTEITA